MMPRTVQWPIGVAEAISGRESLRERKKRLLRQQLSDTATEMFLARGFENVRVDEIAEACDVSEKTVYNYFPTKESLILDRWQATPTALLRALGDPTVLPIDAALRVLDEELTSWMSWYAGHANQVEAATNVRRFSDLVQTTPSLRAYERDQTDQLVAQAAQVIAARMRLDPEDPEPRIAAATLLELWTIQTRSLIRHLETAPTPRQLKRVVRSDVRRASRLIGSGLATLDRLGRSTRRRGGVAAPLERAAPNVERSALAWAR